MVDFAPLSALLEKHKCSKFVFGCEKKKCMENNSFSIYPAPMRPEVTTASPGPRVTQVRLYLMSMLVWMSDTNWTTTMLVIASRSNFTKQLKFELNLDRKCSSKVMERRIYLDLSSLYGPLDKAHNKNSNATHPKTLLCMEFCPNGDWILFHPKQLDLMFWK